MGASYVQCVKRLEREIHQVASKMIDGNLIETSEIPDRDHASRELCDVNHCGRTEPS